MNTKGLTRTCSLVTLNIKYSKINYDIRKIRRRIEDRLRKDDEATLEVARYLKINTD